MLCNWSEFLSLGDVEKIHDTSMELLDSVGVQFHHGEALSVLQEHGARVDGHTVYLGEKQVRDAVGMAPARFTMYARNPGRNVTVGDGEPVFAPGYGAPFVADLDVGRRGATMEDYDNLARLAHALPNQDLSGYLMVGPGDVPVGRDYRELLVELIGSVDPTCELPRFFPDVPSAG